MKYSRALQYFNFIEPLTAEEMQRGITVSVYPHVKKPQAKKIEKSLKKAARPSFDSKAPESTEDLYHSLVRRLGNG